MFSWGSDLAAGFGGFVVMCKVCTAIYFIAKRKKMSDKGASELRVVIDLCYQNLMNEKVRIFKLSCAC